jgi:hypothetical protein
MVKNFHRKCWKTPNISIVNVELILQQPDCLVRRHPMCLMYSSVNSYNSVDCSKIPALFSNEEKGDTSMRVMRESA